MKLVEWVFQGLVVPMMEDEDGELYCTSKVVCRAIGIEEDALSKIHSRHREEFDGLSLTNCHAKDFFREHKKEFEILRVRTDMRLWTEDDMLTFAFHAQSPTAREFRKGLRQFIKQHATRGYVSLERFTELQKESAHEIGALAARLAWLEQEVFGVAPPIQKSASMAGTLLAEQRKTKKFRAQYLSLVK